MVGVALAKIAYADCNRNYISTTFTDQCVSLNFASALFAFFAVIFLIILIIESTEPELVEEKE